MRNTFHKDPKIIIEDGKIIQLIMGYSCIHRDFSFESEVRETMEYLAEFEQPEFMELYLNLSNDEKFLKIASEMYEKYIDKEDYPYEIIKALYMSDLHLSKASELSFLIDEDYAIKLLISDGLVVEIMSKYIYMGACYRNDVIFFKTLNDVVNVVANSEIESIMKFHNAVKNDQVAFKMSDNIRKKLLKATQKKLENTTKKIRSEIDLLSNA